ncbi:MAG: hypothetical protein ACT4QD_13860 [Acidobacteriota bacterium]
MAPWLLLAFVTWNVVFDRAVDVGARAFTREQVSRVERREPVLSLDEAFTPLVAQAAAGASAWAGLVVGVGAATTGWSRRRASRAARRQSGSQ